MSGDAHKTTDERRCGDCWWCLCLIFLVGAVFFGSIAMLVFLFGREAGRFAGLW